MGKSHVFADFQRFLLVLARRNGENTDLARRFEISQLIK